MMEELKILVIRFSSIGDIVLTSPVLRLLNSSKKYEVHFLTKNEYCSLVSENPNIHKIHLLKESLTNIFFDLKKENFDFIIDLHNNIRSNILTFMLFKKTFKLKKSFFNTTNNIHIAERYLLALKKLQIKNDNLGLDFFLSKELEKKFNYNENFIAWCIGSKHDNKKLSANKILEVSNAINYPIIFIGGSDDIEIADYILNQSSNKKIKNFCGSLSIQETATIIKNCSLLITNDTGFMHIGASFKIPIISLWGCTKPDLGYTPYQTNNHSIYIVSEKYVDSCHRYGKKCRSITKCIDYISSQKLKQAIELIFCK